MKIVITGGHHSSALPIIPGLKKRYPKYDLIWFGHKHSIKGDKNLTLEYKEITELGIPFYNLIAGKLYKTYSLKRLIKIPVGVVHAFVLLLKLRPTLVISFGGYLAAPTVLAAFLLGIPCVTHEQTVTVGFANRFIGKLAKKIFISWPQSKIYFPEHKVVVTGLPLRTAIYNISDKLYAFDNGLKTIFIIGGKTGSHKINAAIADNMQNFLQEFNVVHQCGDTSVFDDYDHLNKSYEKIKNVVSGKYVVQKFVYENEIGAAFNKSSVVISRAGAHTTSELLALEKPCILVPIPWVSHNEQFKNAQLLEQAGLCEILEEKDLSGTNLLALAKDISSSDAYYLKDPALKNMLNPNASAIFLNEIAVYLK